MSRFESLVFDGVVYGHTADAVREFVASVNRRMDDGRVRFYRLPNGYRLPRRSDLVEQFAPRAATKEVA